MAKVLSRTHPKPCLLCIIKGFHSRLEKWKFTKDIWRGDTKIITGQIYDDDRWSEDEWGKDIWTTEIQWSDKFHARTKNTNYILGEPLYGTD